MAEKSDPRGSDLDKLAALAYPVLILFALLWAKEFLLPVVLAILVSLLLTPVVSRLERWRFPPVLAVLSVVAIAFAIIAGLCTTVSVEALDLATLCQNIVTIFGLNGQPSKKGRLVHLISHFRMWVR